MDSDSLSSIDFWTNRDDTGVCPLKIPTPRATTASLASSRKDNKLRETSALLLIPPAIQPHKQISNLPLKEYL